jgi:hypothetical protein
MKARRMHFSSGPQRAAAAALLALVALSLPQAWATTLAHMNLRELSRQSTYIARVRCVKAVSVADEHMVWTVTTFEVSESWKGNPPPLFTVHLPGGEAPGLRLRVEGAPRFSPGEDAVLFLAEDRAHRFTILSWAQGTFRIRKDSRTAVELAVQDTAGLQVLDPLSGARTGGERRQLPVAALRSAVARALSESAP